MIPIGYVKKSKRTWRRPAMIVVLLCLVGGWLYYWYNITVPISNDRTPKTFVVTEGMGSTIISHALRDQGFIRSPRSFQMYTWSHGISSLLQPGDYQLRGNMDIREISSLLRRGIGSPEEIRLRFIEGWSNRQVADYLNEQLHFSDDEFNGVTQKKASWWDAYDFLKDKPSRLDLEGYLFPDTYRVYATASIEEIIRKMLDNFGAKLTPELRAEIKAQGKTIHEILTLASIIEKEVSRSDDRKMVADVFYKRLKINMALQSDATVNYITGKRTTRASASDTNLDNPYNTYQYPGLPPGPISNPGLDAIIAAIYPTPNPYYYFLTTPDGVTIFSKTHEEHVAAKQKYY